MMISRERLDREAENTGFRPEVLEKVIHLMELLNAFSADPFIAKRIVLKSGTALNLFCYNCPRLSVDIDINYIGSLDREIMLVERTQLVASIENIALDREYTVDNKPSEHAGGKWRLRYQSELQGNSQLEVDLNFLARLPLWNIKQQSSIALGSYSVDKFPVLDKHELAAGKLTALFARHAGRDLFDAYQILSDPKLDLDKLRLGFLVYGAMSRVDLRNIKIEDINYDSAELKNKLIPMLRGKDLVSLKDAKKWADTLVKTCQSKLTQLLPFRQNEIDFLTQLLDFGEIKAKYLSDDEDLVANIEKQPGLLWKAMNVKKHKGLV